MRIHDTLGNEITSRLRFFTGAKSPKPPKQETPKMPQAPNMTVTPPPAPEPIPPSPTTSKSEVQQAQEDERQQAGRRKGIRQTLLSGETGGYQAATSEKKTLLG